MGKGRKFQLWDMQRDRAKQISSPRTNSEGLEPTDPSSKRRGMVRKMAGYIEVDRKCRKQMDKDHQRFKRNFQLKRDKS